VIHPHLRDGGKREFFGLHLPLFNLLLRFPLKVEAVPVWVIFRAAGGLGLLIELVNLRKFLPRFTL